MTTTTSRAPQPADDRVIIVATAPEKTCVRCGRRIEWRKKWERNWDDIRYCSKSCRSSRLTATDEQLESTIIDLLDQRARDASICPSEAARLVAGGDDEQGWRDLMEPARSAARRLVAQGQVEIVQSGRVVDPSTARGPIRIRRAR